MGRGIEEVLISPTANEDIMGCGPKEKEELIELRFLEVAVDGRRGAGGMAKPPSGGGVEAMSMCKSMTTRPCTCADRRVAQHVTRKQNHEDKRKSLDDVHAVT